MVDVLAFLQLYVTLITRWLHAFLSAIGNVLTSYLKRSQIPQLCSFRYIYGSVMHSNHEALTQCCFNVGSVMHSKHEALTQCCFNVGSPSLTVGQHLNNIG